MRSKQRHSNAFTCKLSYVIFCFAFSFAFIYCGIYFAYFYPRSEVNQRVATGLRAKPEHLEQLTMSENTDDPSLAPDGINDAVTAVVECSTTQGNLTIDIRSHWAPLGAQRFLTLIDAHILDAMPFFRVCPRYITQFGVKYGLTREVLASAGAASAIPDDPTLWGTRDIDFGYVFFAGSGTNSRSSQLVIALCTMPGCIRTTLGKAPWEVPFGTIRKEGFSVLEEIAKSGYPYPRLEMAGQHANASGPNQGRIMRDANYLSTEYPYMQYITSCSITAQNIHLHRPLAVDHPDTQGAVDYNKQHIYVLLKIQRGKMDTPENVILEVMPTWSPHGVDRFVKLVNAKFYDNTRFFRVLKSFVAQFGLSGTPEANKQWPAIPDDPPNQSNVRGSISFAMAGPNTRTTQLFINTVDNSRLDGMGFTPFGRVIHGMHVIDGLYSGYGEGGAGDGRDGRGPNQGRIGNEGNSYLDEVFPRLSVLVSASVVDEKTVKSLMR